MADFELQQIVQQDPKQDIGEKQHPWLMEIKPSTYLTLPKNNVGTTNDEILAVRLEKYKALNPKTRIADTISHVFNTRGPMPTKIYIRNTSSDANLYFSIRPERSQGDWLSTDLGLPIQHTLLFRGHLNNDSIFIITNILLIGEQQFDQTREQALYIKNIKRQQQLFTPAHQNIDLSPHDQKWQELHAKLPVYFMQTAKQLEPWEQYIKWRKDLLAANSDDQQMAFQFSTYTKAIQNLKDGLSYNQSMERWLFDGSKARLPTPEDNQENIRFKNKEIAQNPNQAEAIKKMLAAPELFLLQGPPGTGKTTVIAEYIYQEVVHRHHRVLLSSQSNDAVNNAMEKLVSDPRIRTKRLASIKINNNIENQQSLNDIYYQYGQKQNNADMEKWIKALDNFWQQNILQPNEKLNSQLNLLAKAKNELENFQQQLASNKKMLETFDNELTDVNKNIETTNQKLDHANRIAASIKSINDFQNKIKLYQEGVCAIPTEILNTANEDFAILIHWANDNGIILSANYSKDKKINNKTLEDILSVCSKVNSLQNICTQPQTDNSERIKEINVQLEIIIKNMQNATSTAEYNSYSPQRNELEQELNKLKFDNPLNTFAPILSPERQTQFTANIDEFTSWLMEFLPEIQQRLSKIAEKLSPPLTQENTDINKLTQQKNQLNIKKKKLMENIEIQKENRQNIFNKQKECAKQYGYTGNNPLDQIKQLLEKRQNQKNDQNNPLINIVKNIANNVENCLKNQQKKSEEFTNLEDDYNKSVNVTGMTCSYCKPKNFIKLYNDYFDVVIIDEVSKATPLEYLLPLQHSQKVILCGDHRQLPPTYDLHQERTFAESVADLNEKEDNDREAKLLNLEKIEKFKDLITSSHFKKLFNEAPEQIKITLNTQYRMHSDISYIISHFFYDDTLQNGIPQNKQKDKEHNLELTNNKGISFCKPEKHICWLDSSNIDDRQPVYENKTNDSSKFNIMEEEITISLLRKIEQKYKELNKGKIPKVTVGVISFYEAQIININKKIKEIANETPFENLDIKINTVDRFQGREFDIVIVNLVRNKQNKEVSEHILAFERINVAFSRAKKLLFIVGAQNLYNRLNVTIPSLISNQPVTTTVYANIIKHLQKTECFHYGRDLLTAKQKERIMKATHYNNRNNNSNTRQK